MRAAELWGQAFGLALLYCSAYYLPQVGIEQSYWLPEVGRQVLYPALVALLLLTPAAAWWLSHRNTTVQGDVPAIRTAPGERSHGLDILPLTILSWIAIISAFSALGYSAISIALILTGATAPIDTTRWVRISLVLIGITGLIATLWRVRGRWRGLISGLAVLGYVFAGLAAIRLLPYPRSAFDTPVSSSGTAPATASPRQVIWIIFDELDYNQSLGQPHDPHDPPMPQLAALARMGVSASAAYPPARDTEASIPALLTGYDPIGVRFDDRGNLWLGTRSAGVRRFTQSDSVFARLPLGPQSAAILGYFHPYCAIFPAVHPCEALPEANAGRWFDALTFFGQPVIATCRWLPDSGRFLTDAMFHTFEPMYRISADTVRDLPHFLSLTSPALVFIHVNLPHTPGDYVQRALDFNTVVDDRENYRRNLLLVDQLVAQTVATLQQRASTQDILLVVSADHWHRMDSPTHEQRVPWIAWHVGQSGGPSLETRIDTVHTGDLILDFLRGNIEDQAQIASWWQGKSQYPPLMPNKYRYQF
jgi:hypothetical protein